MPEVRAVERVREAHHGQGKTSGGSVRVFGVRVPIQGRRILIALWVIACIFLFYYAFALAVLVECNT